jgi:hypothetical protein
VDAGPERHALRLARLGGCALPTPAHLASFRLGRVDRPDFFGWMHEGVLRLRDRPVPAGVTLDTECHTIDPDRLAQLDFGTNPRANPCWLQLPARLDPRVAALARRWAGPGPPCWRQVEAVARGLRGHAELDRAATVPPGGDPLAHFLFAARRGPDYQFASACVVMLRSLGFPARLASGYYASPERFDVRTRTTPVNVDDVHFWPEVRLPGGSPAWQPVEPTPGYELLAAAVPWGARLRLALGELAECLRQHAVAVSLAAGAVGLLVWRRRQVADRLGLLWWRRRSSWRAAVAGALRLLERRCRWAGRGRPAGRPPVRHFAALGGEELRRLASLADWAAHAPRDLPPPCTDAEALALCRQALGVWTLRRLRRAQPRHQEAR